MKTAREVQGLEYDWLATDGDGTVALFTTAGGGYVPDLFLEDTDGYDTAIAALMSSPAICAVRFAPELPPHLENTWRRAAERGLFAFDSDPNGGAYCLVAAPLTSVMLSALPRGVVDVAQRISFPGLSFAAERILRREDLEPCEKV